MTNADGETVYEISGAPVDVEAARIPLGRGVYALRVESAQGTQAAVELN